MELWADAKHDLWPLGLMPPLCGHEGDHRPEPHGVMSTFEINERLR